jgi:phosphotransferase family enzyme
VVQRYAEAQLELAGARDDVLACGVAEVSAKTVPAQARALLEELAGLPVAEGGLDHRQEGRLTAVLPELDAWCAELAASAVPDSVQHDDLHSGNVCWGGSVASARVIDWGDATWGFPLTTMLATMNSLAFHAGLYVEDRPVLSPEVLRVRDAYLEVFTAYASPTDLVRLTDLSRRTGCVGKALSYRSALRDATPAERAELEFPEREWLLGLLDG